VLFFSDCLGVNVDKETGALAAVKCVIVSFVVVVGAFVLAGGVLINDKPVEKWHKNDKFLAINGLFGLRPKYYHNSTDRKPMKFEQFSFQNQPRLKVRKISSFYKDLFLASVTTLEGAGFYIIAAVRLLLLFIGNPT